MLKPAPMTAGDKVAIVAPASAFDRAKFDRGLGALRSIGLLPDHGDDLFARYPANDAYLAGGDARRADELRRALRSDAKALMLARGGYGVMRLLLGGSPLGTDDVRPKLIVGYSDATVLHELWKRAGVPSIHGPMCTQLGEDPTALDRLRALLMTDAVPAPISWDPMHPAGARDGRAEGELRGGNLAVLAALCGTPLQPSFRGAVVLLEDLNEPPYRLDRLVTQLLLSGAFEGARGVVVGDLVGQGEPGAGCAEAVAEQLAPLGIPVAFGAPFGHAGRNQPVAFGTAHALDAGKGQLVPLESPNSRNVA